MAMVEPSTATGAAASIPLDKCDIDHDSLMHGIIQEGTYA
jgi:hypothetical protein